MIWACSEVLFGLDWALRNNPALREMVIHPFLSLIICTSLYVGFKIMIN
jgi:hypothetical protein